MRTGRLSQQLSGRLLEPAPTSLMLVCLLQAFKGPLIRCSWGRQGHSTLHSGHERVLWGDTPPQTCPSHRPPSQHGQPAPTPCRAPCSSSKLKSGSHPSLPRPSNLQGHQDPIHSPSPWLLWSSPNTSTHRQLLSCTHRVRRGCFPWQKQQHRAKSRMV